MLTFYTRSDVLPVLTAKQIPPELATYAIAILDRLESLYGVREDPANQDGGRVVLVQSAGDLHTPEEGDILDAIQGGGEGLVVPIAGYFDIMVLANNEYSINYLIPDADWLPAGTRAALRAMATTLP